MTDIETKNKNVFAILKEYGFGGILCLILVYFGGQYTEKLIAVEKQVLSIRIQLTKIQVKLLPKRDIQEMMDKKISQHEKLYHNNSIK